jgi:uncharacterized YigZ family protein
MPDYYSTIAQPASGILREKGSKFLAFAYPFATETDLKFVIDAIKKEHKNASHYCYAYRLGNVGQFFRYNDDGEPTGTAGKPIYNVLVSNDLTNVLVVVVRYFGGTLLGVRGLIDAYGCAAQEAVQASEIIQKPIAHTIHLRFGYEHQAEIQRIAKKYKISAHKQVFELWCEAWYDVVESLYSEVLQAFGSVYGIQVMAQAD